MKTVLVFGTFDLIHPGHLWFLEQAKKYGNQLIVVVSRDAVAKWQKKKILFNENERLKIVSALAIVDKAMLGDKPGNWTMIKKIKPDVICIGHDQYIKNKNVQLQLKELKKRPKLVRFGAYKRHRFSSRLLKKKTK